MPDDPREVHNLSAADEAEAAAFDTLLRGDEVLGLGQLEQAHEAHLAVDGMRGALRTATWLTILLMERGELARGGGWMARLRDLADRCDEDCIELGYALLPVALRQIGAGDPAGARATFAEALARADRFHDPSLAALGRMGTGQSFLREGRIREAVAWFDEAMVRIAGGAVRPMIAGIVYCGTIEACFATFDMRRAQEWTNALTAWWEAHPEVSQFRGQCLIYRAELMRLHGAWAAAMDEAERAREALSTPPQPALGATLYEQAELHRHRGEFGPAEEAYREASRWGRHPEPGLALLRLAQGRHSAAAASIRRALQEAADPVTRLRLLPAAVEIAVATGDLDAADDAAQALRTIAEQHEAELPRALASQAEGRVRLAREDASGALPLLRAAWAAWQHLDAPYESARVRALIAQACESLGDTETAALEREGAAWTFRELGAAPDLAALEPAAQRPPAGLTPRELEVLRLVAAGKSNRDIAEALVISEKTVARHVSNILAKVDAPSRTAAAAYARDHGLL